MFGLWGLTCVIATLHKVLAGADAQGENRVLPEVEMVRLGEAMVHLAVGLGFGCGVLTFALRVREASRREAGGMLLVCM